MTDWKALCDELVDAIELLLARRAALAAEADGPAVPESREPASVVGEPSDEELAQAAKAAIHEYKYPTELVYFLDSDSSEYEPFLLALRAAIAADRSRFGRQPAPLPAGEVAELVAWLRSTGEGQPCLSDEGYARLTRAADLLERQAAPVPLLSDGAQVIEPTKHTILVPVPVPVAVSERPWDREGWCDEQGRCWWGRPETDDWYSDWTLASHESVQEFCTYNPMRACLPAHALPLPAGEVQP